MLLQQTFDQAHKIRRLVFGFSFNCCEGKALCHCDKEQGICSLQRTRIGRQRLFQQLQTSPEMMMHAIMKLTPLKPYQNKRITVHCKFKDQFAIFLTQDTRTMLGKTLMCIHYIHQIKWSFLQTLHCCLLW